MQLSGVVAILSEERDRVVEIRDLGPDPVGVKPGRALPLIEVKPAAERLGAFSDVIGNESVTRTWSVAKPDIRDYQSAIEAHVDAIARQRDYSSAVSCASYANSTIIAWADEAAAFIEWRDAVWAYAFTELAAAQNGQRVAPTITGFLAELPAIAWPE